MTRPGAGPPGLVGVPGEPGLDALEDGGHRGDRAGTASGRAAALPVLTDQQVTAS
ncbi:hypothetical protein AB0G32_35010 [Streptomyces sp. NPDC023723]|uniref:hypothetical protein n=1 Tax=Streptomyces sp. NPDC023723 TaxID=3154323 RepID=UPI0033E0B46C